MQKNEQSELRIRLLHQDAKAPVYATQEAAGCDIFSIEEVTVFPDEVVAVKYEDPLNVLSPYVETTITDPDVVKLIVKRTPAIVKTGVAVFLDEGEELEIRGRSGLGFKYEIVPFNGTIDSDYTGEIKVKVWNLGTEPFTIEKGMRFAQGVIKDIKQKQFVIVDEDAKQTDRSSGGFAHTGLK